MTRRDLLRIGAAAAAGGVPGSAAPGRPNFLIIYADDLGIGDLGCYGAKDVKTPYIDRLAAMGARLTGWYSNSPVCSPSRASLLTGKYPQRTGIVAVLPSNAALDAKGLREGETTLPRELKKLGYRTGHIGKWHLGSAPESRPAAQGYDEFFGFYSGWTDYYSHRYYRQDGTGQDIFHDMWRNGAEEFRDPEYQTELFAREATAFIGRQDRAVPFLLCVAFGAVHYPMMAPEKYLSRFPATMDRERRMHAAVLAAMDDAVGAVLQALETRGLLDNTVVFFQSDNGATQEIRAHSRALPYRGGSNAPYRGFKGGLFEGGIRMPALMAWKGRIRAGQTVSAIGAAMDILPTFLEWAGVPAAKAPQCDGRSVAAMLERGAPSPHREVFWSYLKQRAVREGKWKLLLNPPSIKGDEMTDTVWLSDLEKDPGEKINFASREPAIVERLRARLAAWSAEVGS